MNKKAKYIMQIIAIIITAFLVYNLFFYTHMRESYKNAFYETGNNFTMQTSNALKHWVEDQIKVVKMISRDYRIINACRFPENQELVDEAQDYLQYLHELYPYYENLPLSVKLDKSIQKNINGKEVVIENGEFLIDTVEGKTAGKGGLGYSYIQEIFNGKDYFVSEIYPSILRGNPIFVISAPVIYDSEIIGVAIISPQIDYFTQTFVDNVKYKKTGYLFFVDERGLTIAHPNRDVILSNEENTVSVGKEIVNHLSQDESFFDAKIHMQRKLYAGTVVDVDTQHIKYKWYIVFTQTSDEIFRNVDKFFILLLIIVVLSTIIVVWGVYLVTKINQKRLYEEKLESINRSLEKKVEARTEELRKLAATDSLTTLYNHQASYNILEEEIKKASENRLPLVLLMADLDRFKNVNDTFGHQIGDEVIASTAQIILSSIRKMDIAGRYGGEEFIVILSNTEFEEGLIIAERIRKSVSEKQYSRKDIKLTISMGVCKWEGESSIELVNKADKLLYKAKLNGRNRIEAVKGKS